MSDKHTIKAKLEHTKQLVAEMHEQKRRKEEERKKKESEVQQMAESASEDSDWDRKRSEISPDLPSVQPLQLFTWDTCYFHYLVPTLMSPSSQSLSTSSENGSQESVAGGTMARTLQWDMDPSALQLLADTEHRFRMQRLEATEIVQVDCLPKELVTYCKETQTPVAPNLSEEKEKNKELPVVKPKYEEHVVEDFQEAMQEHPKELTEEEKQKIVHSEEFQIFFDRSIRVVERTLAEDLDIFFDYSGRDMEDRGGSGHFSLEQSFNLLNIFFIVFFGKYMLILNLMPATCFKKLETDPCLPLRCITSSFNNTL